MALFDGLRRQVVSQNIQSDFVDKNGLCMDVLFIVESA